MPVTSSEIWVPGAQVVLLPELATISSSQWEQGVDLLLLMLARRILRAKTPARTRPGQSLTGQESGPDRAWPGRIYRLAGLLSGAGGHLSLAGTS